MGIFNSLRRRVKAFQLSQAATLDDVDKIVALLAEGIDVNVPCAGGRTALMSASSAGHTDLVEILITMSAGVRRVHSRVGPRRVGRV